MGLTKLPVIWNEIQDCTKKCIEEKSIKVVENSHNHEVKIEEPDKEVPYKIQNIAGKGMGMIATKKLYPGDVILAEAPLVVVPDAVFEDCEKTEIFLDKAINKLSSEDREKFLALSDCRAEDSTYVGILYTNDMNYDGDAAIMPEMARVNHSCSPNADFVTRIDLGVQHLYAMTVINIGDEVTISYLPATEEGLDVRETRQQYLRTYYGFRCVCKTCSLQFGALEENNAAREEVKELQAVGLDKLPGDDLELLLNKLVELNCKLSYVLDVVDQLYRMALSVQDVVKMVKFSVKGKNLANIVHGDGSMVGNQWEDRREQLSDYVGLAW